MAQFSIIGESDIEIMKNKYLHLYSLLFFLVFTLSAISGNTSHQVNVVQATETNNSISNTQQLPSPQINDSISDESIKTDENCIAKKTSKSTKKYKEENTEAQDADKPLSALGILIKIIKLIFGIT